MSEWGSVSGISGLVHGSVSGCRGDEAGDVCVGDLEVGIQEDDPADDTEGEEEEFQAIRDECA